MSAAKPTPELAREICRRFKERNAPGYWGVNARAWLRLHIKFLRRGYANGLTAANQLHHSGAAR